jgi:hypothetical protein
MGQSVSSSSNVNPTWSVQHNARYAERIAQTTGVNQEALRRAAEATKKEKS